jgi:hypothetical protein
MGRTMGGFPRTEKGAENAPKLRGLDRDQGARRAGRGRIGRKEEPMRLIPLFLRFGALASPLSAQEAEVGRALYADFCAVCHGAGARVTGRWPRR